MQWEAMVHPIIYNSISTLSYIWKKIGSWTVSLIVQKIRYWNLIHVQASLNVIIGILSTSKRPWWWWLGFDRCTSILDNDYWDLIHVLKPILHNNYRNLVGMTIEIGCVTNFGQKLLKFGPDDNWYWSCHQFLVKIIKIWSRWQMKLVVWPIFGKITIFWSRWQWNWLHDQFFVKITKIWLRWQLKLVTWLFFHCF